MYYGDVIKTVVLSRDAQKDLATVPRHVAIKLQDWVEDVEERGLEEVRKIGGYHDEPLKGATERAALDTFEQGLPRVLPGREGHSRIRSRRKGR